MEEYLGLCIYSLSRTEVVLRTGQKQLHNSYRVGFWLSDWLVIYKKKGSVKIWIESILAINCFC